jgi:hypothetical protein
MKQFYPRLVCPSLPCLGLAAAAVVALGGGAMAPARAVPPTVTPSPGYDARLQEQKTAAPAYQPVARDPKPVSRRRVKPVHDNMH